MSLPYAEPLTPREPGPRQIPEPPRRGEPGGKPCAICSGSTTSALWSDENWTLHAPVGGSLPGSVWLASREHFDSFADMGRIPTLRTIPDGKEVASYTGHELDVTCAEFSSDGKSLLTGSDDRSAALWESDTGKLICMYRNHPGPVKHAAFVGKDRIVTASTDGVLRIWTRDILEQIRRDVHRRFTIAEQFRYDLPAPNAR